MRSRYSAYVTGAIDYLVATHRPPSGEIDREETERWSRQATWLGLEIRATEAGQPSDEAGVVEFVARWRQDEGGPELRHHERSRFRKLDGRWHYIDGDLVKPPPAVRGVTVGRNDPCPCGSGQKYKRCHGR